MRAMRGGVVLAMVLLLAIGCATTGKVAYEKRGVTEAERRRDVSECTHESIGHDPSRHVVLPLVLDRAAFERCLESRGYSRVQ